MLDSLLVHPFGPLLVHLLHGVRSSQLQTMSKDHDRPIFDATAADRRRAFKYFAANFHGYCVIHDLVNPSKEQHSAEYWIAAKRPKALAALRRAFHQSEWDVLTTTINAQISQDEKGNPATWLAELTKHYLGGEPIIQATHHFLRSLNQAQAMSIQDWHTEVRLSYQRCDFPAEAADRLQRDIFVIGLTDTFKRFQSDIISRDNFTTQTLLCCG